MGLLSSISDRFGRPVRIVLNYPEISSVLGQPAEEVYRSQPAMQAVVSFIARNIAQLPLKCYIRADDSDRQRDTTGVAPLLFANPNANMTGYELVERLMSDFKIHGWALWYVIPSADSKSGWEIDPIPPTWVTGTKTLDGFSISEYQVTAREVDTAPVWIDASDCLMFRNYNPDHPMKGLSPVEALKDVLAEQISAWAFRNQAWKNGGRISSYITRPAGNEWSPEARDRFAKSWKAHYSSNKGSDAGGTPIFEDGMELKTVQFNSKEAQWAEATTLSREDVAGVYHVNPAMVWSNDGQTYASVKENARQLYVDTLGPDLQMVENRINTFLLPKIGANPLEYVEFDIKQKLRGSFEEQAAAMQSAVGAPWMSRAEARAAENMPHVDGTDELIVPLNVIEGGLASPRDTAGNGYNSAQAIVKAVQTIIAASKSGEVHTKEAPLKSRGHPSQSSADEITAVLCKFFKRQGRSVIPSISKSKARWKSDSPDWFDTGRWNSELASELAPVFQAQATASAKAALKDLQLDPAAFDEPRIKNYIEAMAQGKATAVNAVTLKQLQSAIDDSLDEDSQGSTPEGVFEKAETSRAENTGLSFATAVAGWGVLEACHQQGGSKDIEKTWIVTSGNPRASHAAMDGETVGYHDTFSNGADWPGDTGALDADETCGCQCELEVSMS